MPEAICYCCGEVQEEAGLTIESFFEFLYVSRAFLGHGRDDLLFYIRLKCGGIDFGGEMQGYRVNPLRYYCYLMDSLKSMIEPCDSEQKVISLILFDIDDFKKVNDTFGHLRGNQVLSRLAAILWEKAGDKYIAGVTAVPHNTSLVCQ